MPRAKQRTPALRGHLLDVAVDVLAAKDVAGFTTRRVAAEAGTSAPAVYELFGDKAGLIREVFFEGFRRLAAALEPIRPTDDPRADLLRTIASFRRFLHENPVLADVMFSRPFSDFSPGPEERAAGAGVRERVIETVRHNNAAGLMEGDPTDIAHAVLALVLGLAAAERTSRLGTSKASVNRRWKLAIDALLAGFAPTEHG